MSQCELMPMPAPSVVLHDGRPATTSLEIAKFFGKRHTDVLRDINNILPNCPEKFSQRNFASANYLDDQAKNRPMFIIFKDGFILLVMGYTGKKALVIKLAYIEAFNALEAELQRQREGALPPADALAPSQQAQLKALVDAKVGMLPKEHQRKGYGEVWSRFARHFEIAKYTQLPPERMAEAVEYLIGLELKVAELALPDMRSLPRFASYDRYAASIEAAYTILSRLNMHDVQFSQARLGTHPLRGADCSRFYNAVMREVQISAAMVDAARNALNNALELRQIAETVW
ncbi:Rha family transcriptional regulator [Bilophila wadsworthia]|uniref:Rha family transcriptional regulator n=1 Tax=Bilophila wadsworthia TaxID=35833 RepID=UPI001EDBA516|nr:Rha family transcriptional regulator [Bilophila wadsworthia]MCG4632888.1 Rha family transcriptional regulator [Bilophila wadsworthia]